MKWLQNKSKATLPKIVFSYRNICEVIYSDLLKIKPINDFLFFLLQHPFSVTSFAIKPFNNLFLVQVCLSHKLMLNKF